MNDLTNGTYMETSYTLWYIFIMKLFITDWLITFSSKHILI